MRPMSRPAALARLLATSALASTAAAIPAFADSGNPCVMQGPACLIATEGAAATPASGAGGSGGPGNAGPTISSTLDTPATYQDDVVTGPDGTLYYSPVNVSAVGSDGAGGNKGDSGTNFGQGGNGGRGGDGGAITFTVATPSQGSDVVAGASGSIASGLTVNSTAGTGGTSALGSDNGGAIGTAGTGGDGGALDLTVGGNFVSGDGRGADIWSAGGNGGGGADNGGVSNKFGGNGAQGGDGGAVDVTLNGYFQGQTAGVHIASMGGDGGAGGGGESSGSGQGGNGDTGGNGQDVSVTLAAGAEVHGYGDDQAGLWVQSLGGQGGQGGGGEIGGTGGQGGNAGAVSVAVNGLVRTAVGSASPGVLAQSLGNVGGNGGHAADWSFNPTGGDGNNGGTPGTVTVTGTGADIQSGVAVADSDTAPGVLAQSIGGSGGIGPSSNGWFAVGGAGGDGSNGAAASVALSDSKVVTFGSSSSGLVAQSIGGGGGAGGDATGGGAVVSMVIGGTGGAGGAASDAYAANLGNGTITTAGVHASGVVMQSIGGGGGSGGSAYGQSYSAFYGASISVGGSGNVGGDGGTVNAARSENNAGSILTTGAESFGIRGQSIGGGGGSGGASTAKSQVESGGDLPGLSLTLSTGGSGRGGGSGDAVYLRNSGLIATSGNGAIGIVGQSIGGGGGSGGDASGASTANGGGFNFQAEVTHGGKGGGGGDGGDVTAVNNGLVITTGESADGMLVQSIGGGGGSGGSGDSKASTNVEKSFSATITMGGSSGGGGEGFNAVATNAGSIITLGDGAHGIVVQTLGGGGGRGGGAAASNSATVTADVTLGGSGGNGGDTFYNGSNSGVTNSGTIATFGADAPGILAQSIGGGGGAGGKSASSMGSAKSNDDGSNGDDDDVSDVFGGIASTYAKEGAGALANYAGLGNVVNVVNGLLGNGSATGVGDDDPVDALSDAAGSGGEQEDDNETTSTALGVAIGGSGGLGGAAGTMTVTNTGTIGTMGHHSDGIVVQSIGGGGGKGGAASSASSSDFSGVVAVGGTGGGSSGSTSNSSNGGQAIVQNSGEVYTVGALANAIVAQSVGSGGGIGGSATPTTKNGNGDDSISIPMGLGGSAGETGISEAASVTSSGALETRGHDSYGIIAQSVSGGGGIIKTLATDLDNYGGSGNGGSAALSKDFVVDLFLGNGRDNTSRFSGAALVTTTQGGTITTSGDNGIGILAQSVAGGGGLALGGKPQGTTALDFLGKGSKSGYVNPGSSTDPDSNQGVIVSVGDDITTSGKGGVGVFAQSVGGSGGIAGDIGWTMQKTAMGRSGSYAGDGGDVTVTVDQGATITTTSGAGNAPGVIAQSVGGGGGWITNKNGAFVGSAGGSGKGGTVTVTVNGTVDATGPASAGIIAQSTGGADNGGSGAGGQVNVTVNSTGAVWGGDEFGSDAAAIYVLNAGTGSTVQNYGVVNTHESSGGYAVYVRAGSVAVTNESGAAMTGNVTASSFTNDGAYVPLTAVDLGAGTLTNRGVLDLTAGARETALTGDLVAGSRSRLVLGADFAAGAADRLDVSGTARLGGGVVVRSETLVPGKVTVLTAGALDATAGMTDATGAYLFDFTPKAEGDTMTVTPSADFAKGELTPDRRSLAGHLQRVWDGDRPEAMATGFAALSGIGGGADYTATLDRLASRQVGAIATARMEASRLFVANMQSCPVFEGAGLMLGETDCLWGRATSATLDHDGSTGAAGFDNDATLLQFGGQRRLDNGLFLTGAVGWEGSRLRDDFGAGADGDSWLVGVGVKHQSGPLLASATLDAGFGSFDTTRSFTVGGESFRAGGSPDARNIGLHGRVAYELPYDSFYLRPSLDLDASWIGLRGYDESGAGEFNLSVDASDAWVLSATPAVEIGTRVDLGDGTVLRPFANAGVRFVSGNDWTVDARFRNAPDGAGGFSSRIDNPNAVATFGAGVAVMTKGSLDLTAEYQGASANGYTAQSGAFKVTWRF